MERQLRKPQFDRVSPVGMSGTMDNGLRYSLFIPGPLSCEEEREEVLAMIDLLRRMVGRMAVNPGVKAHG